jgi:hypothetical protein
MTASAGITGTFSQIIDADGYGFSQTIVGNSLELQVTSPSAVPEPGSLALLTVGGIGLLTRRRRN